MFRWTVHGFPKYSIDVFGALYGQKGKKRRLKPDYYGYVRAVILGANGYKTKYVHTLVWNTFVGEIPEGYEIHHLDHNPRNNALYNLDIVTRAENIRISTEAGRRNGPKPELVSKPVTRISPDGEQKHYPSVKAAALDIAGKVNASGNICRAIKSGKLSYGCRWVRE